MKYCFHPSAERCLRKPRNKILVLMIATGPECIVYIPPAIEALKKFFPSTLKKLARR